MILSYPFSFQSPAEFDALSDEVNDPRAHGAPAPDDGLIAEDVFGVLQVAVSWHCGFPSAIFPIWLLLLSFLFLVPDQLHAFGDIAGNRARDPRMDAKPLLSRKVKYLVPFSKAQRPQHRYRPRHSRREVAPCFGRRQMWDRIGAMA